MGRFLKRVALLVAIPVLLLLGVYLLADPFKTLRPFSLRYFDTTNRDYLSTELFLKNYPSQKYNSYIFGSSRGCGINTYHWLKYLPEGSRQYMFQAWSETLTGMEQKITYIDEIGGDINNAILLIDIPGTFSNVQLPNNAVTIKNYKISGQSKCAFHSIMFWNFLQKPSLWKTSVIGCFNEPVPEVCFDTVSNDWSTAKSSIDVSIEPPKDSLCDCTAKSKRDFLQEISVKTKVVQSELLITPSFFEQLQRIKDVFDKHNTNYYVVITPAYCYTHCSINQIDLKVLQDVFGNDRVYNYSGENELTTDCYDYSDPNHFGLRVGWKIIEDIYN